MGSPVFNLVMVAVIQLWRRSCMKDDISLCPHCYCMTKTLWAIGGKLCGKCHKDKCSTNSNKTKECEGDE